MNAGKIITEVLNQSAACTITAEMYRISAVLHPRLSEDWQKKKKTEQLSISNIPWNERAQNDLGDALFLGKKPMIKLYAVRMTLGMPENGSVD